MCNMPRRGKWADWVYVQQSQLVFSLNVHIFPYSELQPKQSNQGEMTDLIHYNESYWNKQSQSNQDQILRHKSLN